VECVFCRGVLMNWKPGDNPVRMHRVHFPNCDFYMKQEIEDGTLVSQYNAYKNHKST